MMMTGDEVVALEISGLSAIFLVDRWFVGRKCKGGLHAYEYLPLTAKFDMEVLAISRDLSQAIHNATKIVQNEEI